MYPSGLHKGFGSMFSVDSRVRQATLEEGRRTHWLKHWELGVENLT